MNLIAHRGYSGQYPENTMLAYDKAVEAGCDGVITNYPDICKAWLSKATCRE